MVFGDSDKKTKASIYRQTTLLTQQADTTEKNRNLIRKKKKICAKYRVEY